MSPSRTAATALSHVGKVFVANTSLGSCWTRAPVPTTPRSCRLALSSLKTRPKTTRNISGKKNVKNSAVRSRTKPRSMASPSVRSWCQVDGAYAVGPARWWSCAVLPSGQVQEDVLEGGRADAHPVEVVTLGERLDEGRGVAGGDDRLALAGADLVGAGQL